MPDAHTQTILVVGATGYVGGRLVPRLANAGYRVRAAGRNPEKLFCRPWAGHPGVRPVVADVLDPVAMADACRGCDVVVYLVHAMTAHGKGFAEADRRGAVVMAAAAAVAGVERIIYLSGLGDPDHPLLSPHLKSRHEVERILAVGPVPVTSLRAAMILGAGSASFEMLRYLVDRLPVMTPPRWVDTPCQPIAIANVLDYIEGCVAEPATAGKTFDIGGATQTTYRELIHAYARVAGLPRRWVISLPVLTPGLSARWVHLVTPVPATIAQPLAEGLAIPVICTEHRIREFVPVPLQSYANAMAEALERIEQAQVDTCWSDAGGRLPPEWVHCGDADYAGGTLMQCGYEAVIDVPADRVWDIVIQIGGRTGWYHADLLWKIRGGLDWLVGGYGLRRGRRDPVTLRTGDALDFWRVLAVVPNERLTLLAEMKTPGEALLDIRVDRISEGSTRLTLHSRFLPKGLAGILYWYLLYLPHEYVFSGMIRAMARRSGASSDIQPRRFTARLGGECAIPMPPLPNNDDTD